MSEKGTKPDGFLDLLKGMTAEEVCAVNPLVRPVTGSPIDEVVEAIDKATRETAVPSAVREKFVAVAKDGGDQVAGLLSLMRATIPSIATESAHQTTLAEKIAEVAETYGVSLPVMVAKEQTDDEEEAAAAADDGDAEKKDGDDDGEAEESAAEKKADAAVARIDAHEAKLALDKAVEGIAKPSVAKLVREAVDKRIEAGLKPDKVQDAVNEEVQAVKRAAEAMTDGATSFDDLEPTDLDIDLSRTTEAADGEPTAGEAAFYGW